MVLQQLDILNYRNIREASLTLSPNINCLTGNNGMGKTNILDAIYLLSFCKSNFTNIDTQNINHDADFLLVSGTYLRLGRQENIACGLKRGQKKHLKRNGKEYQRITDHIGLLPLVIVSPYDNELIIGGSEQRRKFIDSVIAQTDRTYLHNILAYNQLLKQRNAMLKNEQVDDKVLDIIDMQMGQFGQQIFETRTAFIRQFSPLFEEFYSIIADADYEKAGLTYTSHLQQQDLTTDLIGLRQRDHLIGFTTHGTHKDDIELTINNYPAKNVGSQGQQKTILLALKFAQFEFLKQKHGLNPLLLLDDLFDKLDSTRVNKIVELVSTDRFGQIVITDTNLAHIDEILRTITLENKIFNIKDGKISD